MALILSQTFIAFCLILELLSATVPTFLLFWAACVSKFTMKYPTIVLTFWAHVHWTAWIAVSKTAHVYTRAHHNESPAVRRSLKQSSASNGPFGGFRISEDVSNGLIWQPTGCILNTLSLLTVFIYLQQFCCCFLKGSFRFHNLGVRKKLEVIDGDIWRLLTPIVLLWPFLGLFPFFLPPIWRGYDEHVKAIASSGIKNH